MAILGIERVVYCVDDVDLCRDYFEDFGLDVYEARKGIVQFKLPDNSNVFVQNKHENPIPGSAITNTGVHEVVWGVDTQDDLGRLVAKVSADREVRQDADGVYHFVADGGIAMGLRHWHDKRVVRTSVDPVNSPGNVNRLNTHRKWIARAKPRYISHVVFIMPEYEACFKFLSERLRFRLSDLQHGLGIYARCDGASDHHNIFMLNANSGYPGLDGTVQFHHTNFAVTDLDELMVGKNYMERRGWERSKWGLGRHRIGSALFLYLPCPAGGEAEYGADSDVVDDTWVPRDFAVNFGVGHWMHDMPDFWVEGGTEWEVGFAPGHAPTRGSVKRRQKKG